MRYHLRLNGKRKQVCKHMFLATLGVGEWSVQSWAQKKYFNKKTEAPKKKTTRKKQQEQKQEPPQSTPKETSPAVATTTVQANQEGKFIISIYTVYAYLAQNSMDFFHDILHRQYSYSYSW